MKTMSFRLPNTRRPRGAAFMLAVLMCLFQVPVPASADFAEGSFDMNAVMPSMPVIDAAEPFPADSGPAPAESGGDPFAMFSQPAISEDESSVSAGAEEDAAGGTYAAGGEDSDMRTFDSGGTDSGMTTFDFGSTDFGMGTFDSGGADTGMGSFDSGGYDSGMRTDNGDFYTEYASGYYNVQSSVPINVTEEIVNLNDPGNQGVLDVDPDIILLQVGTKLFKLRITPQDPNIILSVTQGVDIHGKPTIYVTAVGDRSLSAEPAAPVEGTDPPAVRESRYYVVKSPIPVNVLEEPVDLTDPDALSLTSPDAGMIVMSDSGQWVKLRITAVDSAILVSIVIGTGVDGRRIFIVSVDGYKPPETPMPSIVYPPEIFEADYQGHFRGVTQNPMTIEDVLRQFNGSDIIDQSWDMSKPYATGTIYVRKTEPSIFSDGEPVGYKNYRTVYIYRDGILVEEYGENGYVQPEDMKYEPEPLPQERLTPTQVMQQFARFEDIAYQSWDGSQMYATGQIAGTILDSETGHRHSVRYVYFVGVLVEEYRDGVLVYQRRM